MTIKTFTIDWEGAEETIEYEDDLTYGELDAILRKAIDLSDVSKPSINIPEYRFSLLLKVIKKAPFKVGDAVAVRNKSARLANKIMKEVMKDYPLASYLADWVEAFTGSMTQTEQDTQYTTSVQ